MDTRTHFIKLTTVSGKPVQVATENIAFFMPQEYTGPDDQQPGEFVTAEGTVIHFVGNDDLSKTVREPFSVVEALLDLI